MRLCVGPTGSFAAAISGQRMSLPGRQSQFAAFECSRWTIDVAGRRLSLLDDSRASSFKVDRSAAATRLADRSRQPPTFVRQIRTAAASVWNGQPDIGPGLHPGDHGFSVAVLVARFICRRRLEQRRAAAPLLAEGPATRSGTDGSPRPGSGRPQPVNSQARRRRAAMHRLPPPGS